MSSSVKIKKIKHIKCDNIPVYDIEVPKYSNFILNNGLVVHNCKPYQYFKNAIYEQRFKMYKSQELIDELTDLERNINTGKIDHPVNGKKDVSDATCGSTFTASKYAEEYAYDYGEDYEKTILMNEDLIENDYNSKQQMVVDFEEELKKLNPLKELNIKNNNDAIDESDVSFISNDAVIW